jgi:RecB family exonuclease
MPTLTASSITDFLTCPRLYYVKQIAGLHPKQISWKIEVGQIYHEALEIWQKDALEPALRHVKNRFSVLFTEKTKEGEVDAEHMEFQETMVLGMVENTPWDVRALEFSEEKFDIGLERIPLALDPEIENTYRLAGKVDGLGKNRDGRLVIRDYKTKGDIARTAQPHIMDRDLQASLYFYVYHHAKGRRDLEGVEFCLVRRPSIQRRQKETRVAFLQRVREDYLKRPEFYYADNVTYRDPNDSSFFVSLSHIVRQIHQNTCTNRWYENYTQCKGFGGGGCYYLPYCTKEAGWQDNFVDLGPDRHPELEEDGSE